MPSDLVTVVRCHRRYIPISGGDYAGSLALRKSRGVTRDFRRGNMIGFWGDLTGGTSSHFNPAAFGWVFVSPLRAVADFLTTTQARYPAGRVFCCFQLVDSLSDP